MMLDYSLLPLVAEYGEMVRSIELQRNSIKQLNERIRLKGNRAKVVEYASSNFLDIHYLCGNVFRILMFTKVVDSWYTGHLSPQGLEMDQGRCTSKISLINDESELVMKKVQPLRIENTIMRRDLAQLRSDFQKVFGHA